MALAATQRAQKERIRNTCPVPERNCRLLIQSQAEGLNFAEPGAEVSGKLWIDNGSAEAINIAGILIRCEINAIIRFETRFDGRTQPHSKVDNFLAEASWAKVYVFGEDSINSNLCLPPGRSEWPFSFKPTEVLNKLPATIKSPHGTILYQIVAYLQRYFPEVPNKAYFNKLICTSPSRNPGYFNLSLEPEARVPLHFEKCVQKSFFSKKNAYKARLTMSKTGFLPGEEVPFTVSLNNIAGENLTKVALSLVRKLVFKTDTETKTMSTILGTKVTKNLGRDTDAAWSETLQIPDGLGPSFVGTIEFLYILRLEIHCTDRVPVKGETVILVGTTWGDEETDKKARPPMTKQMSSVRQSSVESAASSPPAYSTLSSRQASIETLPPGYEDTAALDIENQVAEMQITETETDS